MNEHIFNEKESLELITQMIQKTRKELEVGSGNVFLCYGYTSVILAIAVYLITHFTTQPAWNFLWFAMFLPQPIIYFKNKKCKPHAVSYTDKMLNNTWKIVGWLMVLTCATIIGMGFLTLSINFSLMLPLALLYVCIGTMISGLVVNVPSITRITVAAAIIPVTLLIEMRSGQAFHASWNLMAAIAFLVALIIPRHILNHKAAKE